MDDDLRRIRRKRWLQSHRRHNSALDSASSSSGGIIDLTSDNEEDDDCTVVESKKQAPTKDTTSTERRVVSGKREAASLASSSAVAARSPVSNISVATYNVWFGPPYPEARMRRIAYLLTSPTTSSPTTDLPLFVGMQEVTIQLSQTLFPLLRSAGYKLISQDLAGGYGCAIAVLTENARGGCRAKVLKSGFAPYRDTIMGRGLLWVLAQITNKKQMESDMDEILFTTTHLESFVRNHPGPGMTYDGVTQRESQISAAEAFCNDCMQNRPAVKAAFITGDLNWDDERTRSKGADRTLLSVMQEGWVDAWLGTRQHVNRGGKKKNCELDEGGYTYDSKLNPMLRGNLRRRFDRCLVRFRNNNCLGQQSNNDKESIGSILTAHLFGTEPLEGLKWNKEVPKWNGRGATETRVLPVMPSDHYGLHVTLGFNGDDLQGDVMGKRARK